MQRSDKWINGLGEYYRHNKEVPAIRITMLMEVFGQHESATLERAAYLYMMDNEHFPSVANFRPYVETADHEAVARTIRRVHRYSDEDIYEWELERGSMRPLVEIDAEIAGDREKVSSMWRQMKGGR